MAALAALVALAGPGCGSDFAGGSGGGDGGDGDAGASGDSAVTSGDGGAGEGGGADADAGPAAEPCTKVGIVRSCKTAAGDGAQTCMEQGDHSLVWGRCVPTKCDASATPGANEVCVPAGDFTMGGLDGTNGLPYEGDTMPAHAVTIRRRFYFDKYEVSYSEFMTWFKPTPTIPVDNTLVTVNGNGDEVRWHGAANVKAPGTDTGSGCTAGIAANDATKTPASINCLTWETALAYCMARGKRLPTEAEWEYVASGMGAANEFPWGAGAPDNTCNKSIDTDCVQANPTMVPFLRPSAVMGNTGSGINNLAGNEAEYVLDFAPPTACLTSTSCWPAGSFDPVNVKDNSNGHVLRGGSFGSTVDQVRPRARFMITSATTQQGYTGFRCVRDDL
jgi:formylglycine-generating enzyme required for sulfatase activity